MFERNYRPDERSFRRQQNPRQNQSERRSGWSDDDRRAFGEYDDRYERSAGDFNDERMTPSDRYRSGSFGYGSQGYGAQDPSYRRYADMEGDDSYRSGGSPSSYGYGRDGLRSSSSLGMNPRTYSSRDERWNLGRGMESWTGQPQQDWGSASSSYGSEPYGAGAYGHQSYGAGRQGFTGQGYGGSQAYDERSSQSFGSRGNDWSHDNSRGFGSAAGTHYAGKAGRGPKGYTRSDERIKDDLSDEFIRNQDIDASEIEIQVRSGEVTLMGNVSSRQEKRMAEDLAETILGVKEVHNQLRTQRQGQQQDHVGQRSSQSGSQSASQHASSSSSQHAGQSSMGGALSGSQKSGLERDKDGHGSGDSSSKASQL